MPISSDLYDELLRYAGKVTGARLFPVGKDAVSKRLARLATSVGISRPVHSHMFRHGLAKRFGHIPGMTASEAMTNANRILRHKSMRTTELYFKTTTGEAKAAHRRLLEG